MSIVGANYGALLSQLRPEVIRDAAQNEHYLCVLEKLASRPSVTRAQRKLIELLTLLIEEYESREHAVPDVAPREVLQHLMEAHQLRQKDLVDIFGTESVVSEVLRGKRELTREHIRRLSRRFRVSPAAFF